MAWLPMYLLQKDIILLNQILNEETELAFIIGNGFSKWIATTTHDMGQDLKNQNSWLYSLWHVPAGPLPLIDTENNIAVFSEIKVPPSIPNPWEGWTQLRTVTPSFGNATSTGVISLEIRLLQRDVIPISHFGWIGNYYREIGYPAHPTTEVFWQRLRKLIRKQTVHIPRANNPTCKKEIYAFPEAYRAIKSGHLCQA